MIQMLIHKVHGAAAELHTVLERLPLRLQSWERGQQGRMNVENFSRKLLHEPGREQAEISGENDQLDSGLAQRLDDGAVMLQALASLAGKHQGGQAARLGGSDAARVLAVADDDGDLGASLPLAMLLAMARSWSRVRREVCRVESSSSQDIAWRG